MVISEGRQQRGNGLCKPFNFTTLIRKLELSTNGCCKRTPHKQFIRLRFIGDITLSNERHK